MVKVSSETRLHEMYQLRRSYSDVISTLKDAQGKLAFWILDLENEVLPKSVLAWTPEQLAKKHSFTEASEEVLLNVQERVNASSERSRIGVVRDLVRCNYSDLRKPTQSETVKRAMEFMIYELEQALREHELRLCMELEEIQLWEAQHPLEEV